MTPAPRPTLGRHTLGCAALMAGGVIGLVIFTVLYALIGRIVAAVLG